MADPITLSPLDPKIQGWIQQQREAGFDDKDVAASLGASNAGLRGGKDWVQNAMKGAPTEVASSGDPGFFGELGANAQNAGAGILDTIKQIWAGRDHPLETGANTIWDMIKGAGGEMQQQQQRAVKDFSSNPIEAVSRGLVGSVPVVGPGVMKAYDQLRAGHPGAAGADYLSTLAQAIAPEDYVGAAGSVAEHMGLRAGGRGLIRDTLDIPRSQVSPPRSVMENLAMQEHAVPNVETRDRFNKVIGDAMNQVRAEVQKHQSVPIRTVDVLDKLEGDIQHELNAGRGHLPDYQKMLDEFDNYIQTYGTAVSFDKAHQLKEGVWEKLSDRDFLDTDAAKSGMKQALMSKGIGLNEALKNASGGEQGAYASGNRTAHNYLALKKTLDQVEEDHPGFLSKAAPYVTGAGVVGALSGLGLGAAGVYHPGISTGLVGLSGVLAGRAMSSPSAMLKLGYFLNEVGSGRGAQFLSHLPRAGAAGAAASEGRGPDVGKTLGL